MEGTRLSGLKVQFEKREFFSFLHFLAISAYHISCVSENIKLIEIPRLSAKRSCLLSVGLMQPVILFWRKKLVRQECSLLIAVSKKSFVFSDCACQNKSEEVPLDKAEWQIGQWWKNSFQCFWWSLTINNHKKEKFRATFTFWPFWLPHLICEKRKLIVFWLLFI